MLHSSELLLTETMTVSTRSSRSCRKIGEKKYRRTARKQRKKGVCVEFQHTLPVKKRKPRQVKQRMRRDSFREQLLFESEQTQEVEEMQTFMEQCQERRAEQLMDEHLCAALYQEKTIGQIQEEKRERSQRQSQRQQNQVEGQEVSILISVSLVPFVSKENQTFHYAAFVAAIMKLGLNRTRNEIVGVQGLADVFFRLKLPFDSAEAKNLTLKIYKTIEDSVLGVS